VLAGAALGVATLGYAGQVGVHDPVMARQGDKFYLFSTGPGITFYSSTDLQNWQPEGRVFPGNPSWAKRVAPSFDGHIWAPDVIKANGKYYLYYSVSAFGKNTSAIGVTTNATLDPKSPKYKWVDQGIVVESVPNRDQWNAIDPNIVIDDKGTPWMTFGSFWGGLKMFKLDASMTRPAMPQEWHHIALRKADEGEKSPNDIEGPFIFKKDGYYYLFASWGLCCRGKDSTYHTVVGRSKSVTGPYLDRDGKDMAKGGGSIVIDRNKDWSGVGHNSAYTFKGKDYLVVHAYEAADGYKQKLKMLEMKWDKDGWPVVDPEDLNKYQSNLK
jgi:arabinan endo-1,5-alpha-L-arabinosidase